MKKEDELMRSDCGERIMSEDYLDILIEENYPIKNKEIIIALTPSGTTLTKEEEECFLQLAPVLGMTFVKKGVQDCEQYFSYVPYQLVPYLYNIDGTPVPSKKGITNIINIDRQRVDLSGKGVLIGIIDTGINYTHPVFVKEEGTSKIFSIWDQTGTKNPPPEGYEFGSEYTQSEINNAIKNANPRQLVPVVDEIGHGTFVAGIAAGNSVQSNNFSGIAPEAELCVVKLKQAKGCLKEFYKAGEDAHVFSETDVIFAINYLLGKSAQINKPLVIYFGGQSNEGPHEGSGNLQKYVIEPNAASPGICFTIPAGDEADAAHHYRGYLTQKQSSKEFEVDFSADQGGIVMNVFAKIPDLIQLEIITPSGNSTGKIPFQSNVWQKYNFATETSKVRVMNINIEEGSGDQAIFVQFTDPTPGLWTIRVEGVVILNGTFDAWLLNFGKKKSKIIFQEPDPYITITSPGNGRTSMTIGGYNNGLNSLYIPSGRGNTRSNVIKPDFVAPAVGILGPYKEGDGYAIMTGTSVANAVVAGTSALFLEWGVVEKNQIEINTVAIKTLLMQGADRRDNLSYPNRQWGFGEMNFQRSLEILQSGFTSRGEKDG